MKQVRIIDREETRTTLWSGGETRELYIYPEGSDYGGRDFLFRISTAFVRDRASAFTALPAYTRLLTPLEEELRLSFSGETGESRVCLKPYDFCRFDGAWTTSSTGRGRDFNLMLKKGCCEGAAQSLLLLKDGEAVQRLSLQGDWLFLFCPRNGAEAELWGKSYSLKAGQLLLARDGPFSLTLKSKEKQESRVICCTVRRLRDGEAAC